MAKILCIYRADCADALGAAWAVHKALGSEVEFVKAKLGDPIPNSIGRDLLILGHLYPLEVLRAMAQEARSVLVIAQDHPDFKEMPSCWLTKYDDFREKLHDLRVNAGPSRSTAGLTWDYLHSNKQPHCDCGDSGICKMECPRYEQKMRAQPPRPHPINLTPPLDWKGE